MQEPGAASASIRFPWQTSARGSGSISRERSDGEIAVASVDILVVERIKKPSWRLGPAIRNATNTDRFRSLLWRSWGGARLNFCLGRVE